MRPKSKAARAPAACEDFRPGRRSHFGGGGFRIASCGKFSSLRYLAAASVRNLVVQRGRLETSAAAIGTGGVSPVTAEQNTHVHFVGLALEPFEEAAHTVPAIVLRQLFHVGVVVPRFAIDDKILVGFRQVLKRHADVDLLPGAGAQQVLLRFAKLLSLKSAHHPGRRCSGFDLGSRGSDRSRWFGRSHGTWGRRRADY